jgi:glycerol-3-phosphate acyltransferase PlsY
MSPILLTVLAYVLGATPTSFWVGKAAHGVDLREHGSGNLGATNAFRVLGWRTALPVMIADVFKGWLPVWLFPQLQSSPDWVWTLAFAGAAIFGHVFSFWVGFRGGKGVATSAGVLLALAPWAVLACLVVWLLIAFGTRYVSLASIAAALLAPFAIHLTPHYGGGALTAFATLLALFVIWAHRSNVARLMKGEENRFGSSRSTAPAQTPTPSPEA